MVGEPMDYRRMADKLTLIRYLRLLDVVEDREVKLSHAGKTGKYIDIKKAYGNYAARDLICKLLSENLNPSTECIVGSGHGGNTPASIISDRRMCHLSLVRLEAKDHGIEKLIDAYVPNEKDRIEIVDDVFTTGGTLLDIAKILESTGAKVVGAHTVVKRNDLDVVEKELPFPVTYVLDATDLLKLYP